MRLSLFPASVAPPPTLGLTSKLQPQLQLHHHDFPPGARTTATAPQNRHLPAPTSESTVCSIAAPAYQHLVTEADSIRVHSLGHHRHRSRRIPPSLPPLEAVFFPTSDAAHRMAPSAIRTALCSALLLSIPQLATASSATTKDEILPSYHYGASIGVECMNRSMSVLLPRSPPFTARHP